MAIASCPDCEQEIELRPLVQVGDELTCPHCESDLVVISLDPLELDWAYIAPAEDDDEWDDDEWDDQDL